MKNLFNKVKIIIGFLLIIDFILGIIFLIDYLFDGEYDSFIYLFWVNIYVVLFSSVFSMFSNRKIVKKAFYVTLFVVLSLFLSSFFSIEFKKYQQQFAFALLGLNVSNIIIKLINKFYSKNDSSFK